MGSLLAARLTLAMRSQANDPGATPELQRVLLYGRPSAHLDAIRKHGLQLTERDGQVTHSPVEVSSHPADVRGSDVVIVLVKAWATAEAVAPLRDYLTRDTIVITLQNGLGNASMLRQALTKDNVRPHVWLGVTTQAAVRTGPGKITHTTDGITAIGRRTPQVNDALSNIAATLRDNGWRTSAVADIHRWVWRKLAINCAINPLTALAGVPNLAISQDQDLKLAAMSVITEVVEVAASQGVRLSAEMLGDVIEDVARDPGNPYSSMYVDLQQGLRTEIDAINGQVVRHAKRANIPVPANTLLTRLVRAHEHGHRPSSGTREGPSYTPRSDLRNQA
jgi:2-dehydropantoate 2-reductase